MFSFWIECIDRVGRGYFVIILQTFLFSINKTTFQRSTIFLDTQSQTQNPFGTMPQWSEFTFWTLSQTKCRGRPAELSIELNLLYPPTIECGQGTSTFSLGPKTTEWKRIEKKAWKPEGDVICTMHAFQPFILDVLSEWFNYLILLCLSPTKPSHDHSET